MKSRQLACLVCLLLLLVTSCGDEKEEVLPLEISEITVSAVTETTALISWITNKPATSEVHYGTTTAYGQTKTDPTYSTTHSLTLTNLTHSTLYHFKVCSTDQAALTTCSQDSTFRTSVDFVARGWELFEAKNYQQALASFQQAISTGYKLPEAHLGAGWSNLMLENISNAITSCNNALSQGWRRPQDAYCALCIAYLATLGTATEAQNAASYADSVLSIDPRYTFSHLTTINYLDVHLVRAEAYLYLGDYAKVQQSLDVLHPPNGLNPADPATWVVNGRRYNTYLEALIAEIEYVRPSVTQ